MRGHGKRMPRWGRLRALNSPFTHGLSLHQEVIIKIVVDVTYPTSAPLMGRSSVGGDRSDGEKTSGLGFYRISAFTTHQVWSHCLSFILANL